MAKRKGTKKEEVKVVVSSGDVSVDILFTFNSDDDIYMQMEQDGEGMNESMNSILETITYPFLQAYVDGLTEEEREELHKEVGKYEESKKK